mmetsp:Transcript_45616/g.121008  ORF Transcript_45616/g.121008 Transcript_45616/m.121008 type:complete len:224 (-) Transcript_45616:601-1272(-)
MVDGPMEIIVIHCEGHHPIAAPLHSSQHGHVALEAQATHHQRMEDTLELGLLLLLLFFIVIRLVIFIFILILILVLVRIFSLVTLTICKRGGKPKCRHLLCQIRVRRPDCRLGALLAALVLSSTLRRRRLGRFRSTALTGGLTPLGSFPRTFFRARFDIHRLPTDRCLPTLGQGPRSNFRVCEGNESIALGFLAVRTRDHRCRLQRAIPCEMFAELGVIDVRM